MKKTAVTTLLIRMFGEEWPNNKNFNDMVDEVLELEKQQIMEAWVAGIERGSKYYDADKPEQYFNQTYGAGDGVRKLDI
jgi:hypothetical protein